MRPSFVVVAALFIARVVAGCAPASPAAPDILLRLPVGDCRAGDDCDTIDFGSLTSSGAIAIDVVNEGGVQAAVAASASEDGGGGAFELLAPPASLLAPGESSPLAIGAARPGVGAEASGTLRLEWFEGAVIPGKSSSPGDTPKLIQVALTSTGIPNAGQCPTFGSCDLPDTVVGETSSCALEIKNATNANEIIDDINIDGAAFLLENVVLPNTVERFTSLLPVITARPRAAGANEGTLFMRCGASVVTTTIVVNGVAAP